MATAFANGGERRAHVLQQGLVVLLSAATVLWLAAQAYAGWQRNDYGYPVTAYAMYAGTSGQRVDLFLEGRDHRGNVVRLEPHHFGLSELQLRGYLRANVLGWSGPVEGADQRLESVAGIWSTAHDRQLEAVWLRRQVRERHAPQVIAVDEEIVRWERP